MATVYTETRKRLKRNSYIIYYKHAVSGKNKYYKTFQRRKEAQTEANRLRGLLDTGKRPEEQIIKIKKNYLSVSEIGELLLDSWREKLKSDEISHNTFEGYNIWLNHSLTKFHRNLACEVRQEDIIKYRKHLADTVSKVTSNRVLFTLKQLFKLAEEQGAIHNDPTYGIRYLSEKEHERNSFIIPIQIDNLIKASQQTRAKYYMPSLIYLGAEHGTSRQEALSLKWEDINFDLCEKGTIYFYRIKNGNERTQTMMPRTKQALLDWKSHLEFMRHRVDQQIICF